ncbi:vacuolar membrane protein-domain-containing protein [Mycena pura]|uniref:Vacuolar membrane protein-domain-containing protein n=1 Tax=Mycena pura TaxID=153505 RepID=A0AAD6YSJ8_9AGAR|nr:vacuolar membrane protein-domain-containing protein [Mycena pura]
MMATNSTKSSGASSSGLFGGSPDVDTHSCQLLGPTALIVQALMGVLVVLSLVYKRHREKPMRPWRIWLFDVSKQAVGQMFIHGVNVLVSDLVSHYTSNNACVFYFLNILIDTTLGIAFIYVVLRLLTYFMTEKLHFKGYESGMYGTPPAFKYWLRQATLYVCALCTMKFMVIGLLALFPGLFTLGAWLLSWTYTEKGDALQVIFTMGVFPIIMNIIQFWLIDSIVKASGVALDLDTPDPLDREPLFGAPDDDDENPNVYAEGDIESRPRALQHSHSSPYTSDHSGSSDHLHTPAETKLSGTSTPDQRTQPVDMHAYPPSLTGSASSASSVSPPQWPVLREATKPKPKRRGPPSPIHIRNNHRPAVNSPRQTPKTAPTPAPAPAPAPVTAPAPEIRSEDAWGDSWDDTDDWADKVGDEDWTGRRLEEKKGALSAWDAESPMVNSVHVDR